MLKVWTNQIKTIYILRKFGIFRFHLSSSILKDISCTGILSSKVLKQYCQISQVDINLYKLNASKRLFSQAILNINPIQYLTSIFHIFHNVAYFFIKHISNFNSFLPIVQYNICHVYCIKYKRHHCLVYLIYTFPNTISTHVLVACRLTP